MKVRSGFISNSSSSSFIVAVDSDTTTKIVLSIDVDLANHADIICKTINDLDEHYLDEWIYAHDTIESWLDDKEDLRAQEQYKQAKKAIENGKKVLLGKFSDDTGDPGESMLCYSGLKGIVSDEIEIIHSEGGY